MRTQIRELPACTEDRIDLGAASIETRGIGQPVEQDDETSFYQPLGVSAV
jgi:hypothetical protein